MLDAEAANVLALLEARAWKRSFRNPATATAAAARICCCIAAIIYISKPVAYYHIKD